ncbi:uncharacterized protein ACNLHF_016845 isoform 1-T1 [Anomaloglossus baeobatrachus]|uniref:uncharacterized protein LOC142272118 isoform X1 n=1 Tax=Anomaloglossus baeobatrachus TaxID=238106 RepID=UPI003F505C95
MVPLVLVFAATVSLASSGLVTAKDPIPHTVEGQLGSDLLVPVNEACAYQGSYRFDLLSNTQRIGAYDDELQGLRGYHGRLTYDPETCTITLKRLRAEDGTIFTVNLYYAINHKSITHDIKYKVIIIDHTSCNKTQVSDDAVLGFVSFCLSQDSAVNLVFTLLLLTLQGFCPSLYERSGKVAGLINYIITAISPDLQHLHHAQRKLLQLDTDSDSDPPHQ